MIISAWFAVFISRGGIYMASGEMYCAKVATAIDKHVPLCEGVCIYRREYFIRVKIHPAIITVTMQRRDSIIKINSSLNKNHRRNDNKKKHTHTSSRPIYINFACTNSLVLRSETRRNK